MWTEGHWRRFVGRRDDVRNHLLAARQRSVWILFNERMCLLLSDTLAYHHANLPCQKAPLPQLFLLQKHHDRRRHRHRVVPVSLEEFEQKSQTLASDATLRVKASRRRLSARSRTPEGTSPGEGFFYLLSSSFDRLPPSFSPSEEAETS